MKKKIKKRIARIVGYICILKMNIIKAMDLSPQPIYGVREPDYSVHKGLAIFLIIPIAWIIGLSIYLKKNKKNSIGIKIAIILLVILAIYLLLLLIINFINVLVLD